MKKTFPKILVILGPTASGKSGLAVRLAKKFNGEIISADSRQVYSGLDIGTGKITKKEMRNVSHYMLDILSPKKIFSVQEYKKQTDKIIKDILSRNRLPILCGGTGFYIQAVMDNISFPDVLPNIAFRKKLEDKTPKDLFGMLYKLDPKRAENIDKNNKVRIIRAIEIARSLGKVPEMKFKPKYDVLQIGIDTKDKELKKKIHTRLLTRLTPKNNMVAEARILHDQGLSWKRMLELGLEYRYLALFLQDKITREEMIEKLNTEIWHYAKRQRTWFRRDKRIKWFTIQEIKKIEKEIKIFLKS